MVDGHSGGMDASAVGTISEEILRAVAIRVDKDIWAGINTEATADSDVVDVTVTALTASNVIAEIGKVYNALASIEGFSAEGSFIAMSPQDKALLEQAYAGVGTNMAFYLGEKAADYIGVRIVASVGVPKDAVYASNVANMFYFTDLASDQNQVAIKDMDETDLSGNIRFKAIWTAAASYADGAQFVMAKTA